jgi:hypothetical protein
MSVIGSLRLALVIHNPTLPRERAMTTRAAARQRQRRVYARWRAAALPASYTTIRDTH